MRKISVVLSIVVSDADVEGWMCDYGLEKSEVPADIKTSVHYWVQQMMEERAPASKVTLSS
jgi:hypothetical protein